MRIVLLTNAASGKGGSHALATQAADALGHEGHQVTSVSLAKGWEQRAAGAELIVVCGGDGSISAASSHAAACAVPLYHLPRGTENLFAREFGMRPDVEQLVASVRAARIERFDLGVCACEGNPDRTFALMCSVGFDADVLHALAARRKGPISHSSYVRPVVACLMKPTIRTLTIEADGRVVVDAAKGNVVVSNCARYALGIDPSRDASMTDGKLDVFFAPSASSLRTVAWMGMALAGAGRNARSIVRARAERVTIRISGPHAEGTSARNGFQLDGEAVSLAESANGPHPSVTLFVRPRALPVLLAHQA